MAPPTDPGRGRTPPAEWPPLMLVTDRHRARGRELAGLVREAAAGGVRLVQFREKDLSDEEAAALLGRLREALPPEVRLLVNGRPALARRFGAGLHLAAGVPLPHPPPPRWGRAVHGEAQARDALRERPDYLLLGTVFPTASKPGRAGIGLAGVRRVAALRDGVATPRPALYAIGGVDASRAPGLREAGADGIAVCGALLSADDPRAAAAALIASWSSPAPAPPSRTP